MARFITRRTLLTRAIQASAGVLAASVAGCGKGSDEPAATAAAGSEVCADPAQMSLEEGNARAARNYVEASANPAQACAGCTFFRAASRSGACAPCDMFNGGPVNAGGHCDSWTARATAPAPGRS